MRQRGTESWELRVHVGRDPETGKKQYATKTVRGSKREAERALARLVAEVEDGAVAVRTRPVAELCERWFSQVEPDLSPTTAHGYRLILDRRILPTFGDTPLCKLRTSDLDQWYSELRRRGGAGGRPLASNTVMRVHAVLHRVLAQALRWDWITAERLLRVPSPWVQAIAIDGALGPVWHASVECRLDGRTFDRVVIDVVVRASEVQRTESIPLPGTLSFADVPVVEIMAVDLCQHFGEKLHSMVRQYGDRPSSRVKDLADLVLFMTPALRQPPSWQPPWRMSSSLAAQSACPSHCPTLPPTGGHATPSSRAARALRRDDRLRHVRAASLLVPCRFHRRGALTVYDEALGLLTACTAFPPSADH